VKLRPAKKAMPIETALLHFSRTLALILCVVALASAQKKEIRVAAASDLQTAMPGIAKAFETESGTRVELIFGSSGNLFAQIQNGAPFDLFFSADTEFPDKLMQSGRAEPRSRVVYAIGRLVLWLPPGSKCDLQAEKWNCLLKPEVAKIAIANPAHAPYGRAAVHALQSARLYQEIRPKLVFGENIAQAAQFAQSGNAQAGLLSLAQVHSPALQNGKHWEVPRDAYPPIEQAAIMLKSARERSAAQEFVQFLTDGRGRSLLETSGFEPPGKPQSPTRHK
jgi:molybdate transport system substrate-binding protein